MRPVNIIILLAIFTNIYSCKPKLNPCQEFNSDSTSYFSTFEPIPEGMDFSTFRATNGDKGCGEILSRGIINTTYLKYNSEYKSMFLDYLYTKNFQEKQQVIDAGIGADFIIPGVPALIGVDGNFNKQGYQNWRSEYKSFKNEEIQQSTSIDFFETRIDENIVAAWRHCKTLESTSIKRGLQTVLIPLSKDFAELSICFLPVIEPGVSLQKVSLKDDIKIIGGIPSCYNSNKFKKGSEINASVRKLLIKRTPNVMLQVHMTFDNGAHDKSEYLNPPPIPNKLYFSNTKNSSEKLYVGDSTEIVWEVLNAKNVYLNNRPVKSTGTIKVQIQDSTSYILKWQKNDLDFELDTIVVKGNQKPPMLQKAIVLLATPTWADGKNNNDSHLSIELFVSKSNGKIIIGKGELKNGTEINQGKALPVEIYFSKEDLNNFSVEDLTSAYFVMHYRKPNDNIFNSDVWTFRAEFSLIFDQGLVLYSGYNEPAATLRFGKDSKPYYFPTIVKDILLSRTARTLIIPCQ